MNSDINFIENLNCFVKQMPTIAGWKKPDLTFGGLSNFGAKLAGLKCSEDAIGITDHDIKCEAVNFANQFREQSNHVLKTKKNTGLRINLTFRKIIPND